jgi:hypothetical protein
VAYDNEVVGYVRSPWGMSAWCCVIAQLAFACATEYQRKSYTGGYSETQFDRNVFVVNFRGNGFTSEERVADFVLLRSSELALQHGFAYFVVVSARDVNRYSAYTAPNTSQTSATVSGYGNTAYVQAQTVTYGGQTYLIKKPGRTNTIVCLRRRPDGGGLVYDASFLRGSISEKYGIVAPEIEQDIDVDESPSEGLSPTPETKATNANRPPPTPTQPTPAALYQRGSAFWLKGLASDAEKAFEECLILDPDYFPCHYGRFEILSGRGEEVGALQACDAAIKSAAKAPDGPPRDLAARCADYRKTHGNPR